MMDRVMMKPSMKKSREKVVPRATTVDIRSILPIFFIICCFPPIPE